MERPDFICYDIWPGPDVQPLPIFEVGGPITRAVNLQEYVNQAIERGLVTGPVRLIEELRDPYSLRITTDAGLTVLSARDIINTTVLP